MALEHMSTIFVTGAGGMVGSSLVARLKASGYDRLLTPNSAQLDLRDQAQVRNFFATQQIAYVFHLAGHIGGIGGSVAHPVEFAYENMIMAMNVIHSAYEHRVKKLLFLGSSCIYPRDCPQPMKEEYLLTGPLEPTNEGYALAKISGMKLCEYLHQQYGADFITLMPCNLYGYKDHFETKNSHVISAMLYKFHQAKIHALHEVEVWGTGEARREFLFAEDLVDAMIYFMNKYSFEDIGSFINIGSGVDYSIRELANMVREVVGYGGEIRFDKSRPDGMPRKLMDVSRAYALDWEARTELSKGLRLVYENYLTTA